MPERPSLHDPYLPDWEARAFLENMAELDAYQTAAVTFAVYPKDKAILYPTLGLVGEAGEVAEKVKKSIRDGHELDRKEVAKELGDVLWYIAALARDLDLSLNEIADMNIRKLLDRKARGVVSGSGDNR